MEEALLGKQSKSARTLAWLQALFLEHATRVNAWWKATSSPAYLSSSLSRRRFWHISIPLTFVLYWIMDACNGAHIGIHILDLSTILVMTCITTYMPRHSLLPDVCVVITFLTACCFANLLLLTGDETDAQVSPEVYPAWIQIAECSEYFVFTILVAFGIQSGIVATGSFALAVLNSLLFASTWRPSTIWAFVPIVVGFVCDRNMVWAYNLEMNHQKLLDQLSGRFSVDIRTGAIISASDKMRTLFDDQTLSGKCFQSFIRSEDIEKFNKFLKCAGTLDFTPVLVSCIVAIPNLSFDAHIIPFEYCASSKILGVCLQLVGEIRPLSLKIPTQSTNVGSSARSDPGPSVHRRSSTTQSTASAGNSAELPSIAEEGTICLQHVQAAIQMPGSEERTSTSPFTLQAQRMPIPPVCSHLGELLRHLPAASSLEAKYILLVAAHQVLHSDHDSDACFGWTCNLCTCRNDEEDDVCFCCLCERGMDAHDQISSSDH